MNYDSMNRVALKGSQRKALRMPHVRNRTLRDLLLQENNQDRVGAARQKVIPPQHFVDANNCFRIYERTGFRTVYSYV